jgi:HPt (histidine-containing phosphotransfer) domain-containing protein
MAPQLRRALADGNTEKALAAVRSFKGTAGTLGLDNLEARAAELEQAIRKGRDSVPELRQLERAIDEARREIITSFGL